MLAMNFTLHNDVVDLQRRGILRLEDAAGVVIECQRGLLWITQEADERDIVLHAGDSVPLSRDGLTLVEAIEPATLTLAGYRADFGIRRPVLYPRRH